MIVSPDLKIYHNRQASMLTNHGHEIWDAICAYMTGRGWFKLNKLVEVIRSEFAYAPRTLYLYTTAVLNNVLLTQGTPICLEHKAGKWRLPEVIYN